MRWGGQRREEDMERKEGKAIFTQWEKTDLPILKYLQEKQFSTLHLNDLYCCRNVAYMHSQMTILALI